MMLLRLAAVSLSLLLPSSEALPPAQSSPILRVSAAGPPQAAPPLLDQEASAPAVDKATAMPLGVQTHFSQGWPASLVDVARRSGTLSVRDGAPWSRGEPSPGRYDLAQASPLDAICQSGGSVVLTLVPRHPSYDDNLTVNSPPAIAAFARYAAAVAERYGACLAAIEVGNEINDARNLPYPPDVDVPTSYVALVRAVRAELRRRGVAAAVLGGSTNVIGTGFLDTLFAAGLLEVADGIAVHPYRSQAESVDFEIDHLRAVMRGHGRVRPIWATEFSDNYATPEIAAEELVKMVTLLSAAGLARAYWYALIDQSWFRNMGLYEANGRAKPAAAAFAQMAALSAAARAAPVDLGDPGIRLYRFGSGEFVLWGGGGSVAFDGARSVRDAYGRAGSAATPITPGQLPQIVTGASAARLAAPSGIVGDSLFGYGHAPWSYLAQTRDGTLHELGLSDGTWESSYSARNYQPLRIANSTAAVAGTGSDPVRAVLRYTSPTARRVSLSACFYKQVKGDGVDVAVIAGGRTLWRQVLTQDATVAGLEVELARGGTVDVSVGPNQTGGGDAFGYRVRLFTRGATKPVACPHRAQPVD
jgi:hypothetical protein